LIDFTSPPIIGREQHVIKLFAQKYLGFINKRVAQIFTI
jgi:hypothetical protein